MSKTELTRKAHAIAALSLLLLAASLIAQSSALLGLSIWGLLMLVGTRFALREGLGVAARTLDVAKAWEGDPVPVKVSVLGPRRGTAFLEFRDTLPLAASLSSGSNVQPMVIRARSEAKFDYEAVFPRLGAYEIGPGDVRREDPLGLLTRTEQLVAASPFLVRPKGEPLRRSPDRSEFPRPLLGRHEVSQPGEGFDFFGLRGYLPGDRMRSVNWKASARMRSLVVNQFERESFAEVVLFLDARELSEAGFETHTPFAQSARAAASFLQRFARARDRVRLIIYGPGVHEVAQQGSPLRLEEALDALAEVVPGGQTKLGEAVDEKLATLSGRSPVVILSPLLGDDTLDAALVALRSHDQHVTLIVPAPFVASGDDPSWRWRLLDQALLADSARSLEAVVIELSPSEPMSPSLQGVH